MRSLKAFWNYRTKNCDVDNSPIAEVKKAINSKFPRIYEQSSQRQAFDCP